MGIERLTSVDAFVVRDIDGVAAEGLVRVAPKILLDGARWLARSLTYRFASFEVQRSGASAGVNAPAEGRADAVSAFVEEMSAALGAGTLALEPGKGIEGVGADQLREADARTPAYWDARAGLLAAGVVCAASSAGDLDGRSVTLEGIDSMGSDVATLLLAELEAAGSSIVAATAAGAGVTARGGVDWDDLRAVARGEAPEGFLSCAAEEALTATTGTILAGTRAGVLGHELAAAADCSAVVPWGPIPVTAKALAEFTRRGCVVLPDFVTTAGPSLADPVAPASAASVAGVRDSVAGVLGEVADHEHGPLVGACLRAESFLSTWCTAPLFGRPIA